MADDPSPERDEQQEELVRDRPPRTERVAPRRETPEPLKEEIAEDDRFQATDN